MGKIGGLPVFIYENPSISDYVDLIKQTKLNTGHIPDSIRFFADAKTKKVFVTDAYAITHDDMRRTLSSYSGLKWSESPWIFDGVASLSSSGNVKFDVWDKYFALEYVLRDPSRRAGYSDWLNKVFSYNWTWIDKFIPGCSKLISFYKDRYQKIISGQDIPLLPKRKLI
jgi:hypothetical protein